MPYQRVARILAAVLTLLAVLFFLWPAAPGWLETLAYILTTLVVAALCLDLYYLGQNYRLRRIFFVRNPRFLGSVLAAGGLLYLWLTAGVWVSWFLMIPVLLYYAVHDLNYIYIDDIRLSLHHGFWGSQEIPLFNIEKVQVGEHIISMEIMGGSKSPNLLEEKTNAKGDNALSGQVYMLQRRKFFAGQWRALQTRMKAQET